MADRTRRRSESRSTRRRVLGRAVGTVGTIGAIGIGGVDGARAIDDERRDPTRTSRLAPSHLEDVPLIDVHTHLIPVETLGRPPHSVEELVDWMDDNGVDRAVVLSLDSPESYPVMAPSWWVLEQVADYPDRLLPFCTVDPRTLVYDEEPVEELLADYVEAGARGFGELKVGLPIDDDRLETLYELCAEYDLPILFHTDEKAMMDEVGLPGLEDVLASHPDVDFLAHAPGWWSHIAADVEEEDLGGYPDGSIEDDGRVHELLSEYDNVYGDLSGPSGWNALERDETYAQRFFEEHHEQLVFGTDYLYPGQEISQFELFERFDLDEDAWADVRHRTFEGLLR